MALMARRRTPSSGPGSVAPRVASVYLYADRARRAVLAEDALEVQDEGRGALRGVGRGFLYGPGEVRVALSSAGR